MTTASAAAGGKPHELVALVSWLQTFPVFTLKIIDGKDGDIAEETVSESLSSLQASRYVTYQRTDVVCETTRIERVPCLPVERIGKRLSLVPIILGTLTHSLCAYDLLVLVHTDEPGCIDNRFLPPIRTKGRFGKSPKRFVAIPTPN